MKRSKKLYYSVCSLLPTGILKKIAPADIILPYHHLVSDEDVLHIKHLFTAEIADAAEIGER